MAKLYIDIGKKIFNTGFFNIINFTWQKKFNGVRIKVPIVRGVGLYNIRYTDEWMITVIGLLLTQKNGTFIDVGINTGQTLIKLKSVNTQIDYIGFEPNPSCVSYVYDLIEINKWQLCTVVPVAIFNKTKISELELYSDNKVDATASLIQGYRPSQASKSKKIVPVFKFNHLKDELLIEDISIIKIDVEGAEYEVLKELEDTIMSFRPFIILEILPTGDGALTERTNSNRKIEKLLKKMDCSLYRIIKGTNNSFSKLRKIDIIEASATNDLSDYVIMPNENKVSIQLF